MTTPRQALVAAFAVAVAGAPATQVMRPTPVRIEVAHNVYLFRTAPDQAREAILPGLAGLMAKITGNDPALNDAFKVQLVDWYLHRVFDELDGPLSDAIAPIPAK